MTLDELRSRYEAVKDSDDVAPIMAFTKDLLAETGPEALRFHYDLLRQRDNRKLYQHLRAAFLKRGAPAEQFLLSRLDEEADPKMRADVLQLLGHFRNPIALERAREAVASDDPDYRYRGTFILGWMGGVQDIPLLNERLLTDTDDLVRSTAAPAQGLQTETEEPVIQAIVLALQTILKKRFGLRENVEEREVAGDVRAAREKALRALDRLDL
jgi:HEAT repeat protein